MARVVGVGLTLALMTILGRVVQLQAAPGAKLAEHMYDRTSVRPIPAVRGDLTDRRGRLLSTTRFGYRAFVDPVMFPDPPDLAIPTLAAAIDVAPDRIGQRVLARMESNREKLAAAALARMGAPSLSRYVSLGGILTPEQVNAVKSLKMPGVHLERRSVREYPGQAVAASLIGKVGVEHDGLLGAELSYDEMLRGSDGSVAYVRDAMARPLWIDAGQFVRPERGHDANLSIDLCIQQIAQEELERGIEDADAAGGRIVVMDSVTGEILAMMDLVREVPGAVDFPWEPIDPNEPRPPAPSNSVRYKALRDDPGRAIHPALARNRCIEDIYEPGSTFKPFVWAIISELGLVKPDEKIDTGGGKWNTSYGRLIEDVIKRDHMAWTDVLVNSSNIGMAKGAERLSFEQLHDGVVRFGFGSPTGLGLPGEASGLVTSRKAWSKYTQTSVAFGYEVAVTPVQMVRAFGVFARPGTLAGTVPPIRLTASGVDNPHVRVVDRVLPSSVAVQVRGLLEQVASSMERKMAERWPEERRWRYRIFGESGTAEIPLSDPPAGMRRPRGHKGYLDNQYNSSFIAGAPVDHPRIVVLVVIDDPGPERVRSRTYFGSHVAGPVVRRVVERTLTYLGAAASPTATADAR
jgi:cell division protein FtsI (penicillin-binding protein 3)